MKITEWTEPGQPLVGEIVEILGRDGDPGLDVLLIVRDFGIATEFLDATIKAAEKVPDEVQQADLEGRDDFREWMTFTIDGITGEGFRRRAEHRQTQRRWLAAGCAYRRRGALCTTGAEPIDLEAVDRATSIYPVDRVVPMLPEKLSNGLCSLRPDVDRLSMSAIIDLDAKGKNCKNTRLAIR